MDNPCGSWLPEACWDNVTELDKLSSFQGLTNSFEQNGRGWSAWYRTADPEMATLPGDWENSLNELQRMLIVRSLRSDRVQFCATSFIVNNLGPKFVEPPVLDMKSVVDDSNCKTPLIFVLSPGVVSTLICIACSCRCNCVDENIKTASLFHVCCLQDPTSALLQLAEQSDMTDRFSVLSLGQGQAPLATKLFKTGVDKGRWIFLANCHLSLSWMPTLDKLIEELQV